MKREQDTYVIDAVLRAAKVLEALAGTNFEPVSIQRVEQRTGFSYDFCRRALITWKRAGFATENAQAGKWPKLMRFGANFNEAVIASFAEGNSESSELATSES